MKAMMSCVIAGAILVVLGCGDEPPSRPRPPEIPETEFITTSDNYLNNRFFKLDLAGPNSLPVHDVPGRDASRQRIDRGSIRVYRLVTGGEQKPDDVANIAAYLDTTGVFWVGPDCPPNDFRSPVVYGARWRELAWQPLVNADDEIQGLDVGSELGAGDALAVVYDFYPGDGDFSCRIGDRPPYDPPLGELPGVEAAYYRMKLLKAPEGAVDYSFHYVIRNFYELGHPDIDANSFRFVIEENSPLHPSADANGLPYLRIFGLDQIDLDGIPGHDGLVDIEDYWMIDLNRGLVHFPLDWPFAASRSQYEAFADSSGFTWDGTYLQGHQAHELYDPQVPSATYPEYGHFRLRATYTLN
ncbi:MAG: hypothetical protein IPI34_06080 [bacterium]|nr:hypothetical protein [bacterium]